MKQKLYIKGEQCCYRCGMTKKDVKRSGMWCYTGYQTYPRHMWTAEVDKKLKPIKL